MRAATRAAMLLLAAGLTALAAGHDGSGRTRPGNAALKSAKLDTEIKLAVQQLRSANPDTRREGTLTLLRPEYAARLQHFATPIIAALRGSLKDGRDSESSAMVLGLLTLPQELASQLRASPRTPDKVKARLGDWAAESRVIAAFQAAQDLYNVRQRCDDLLYVHTPRALQAFAQGLQSSRTFEDVHGNKAAMALILIECYGRHHPDQPLFSSNEFLKHANVTPQQFQQRSHQQYLRRIEAYFLRAYHLHIRLNPPYLLDDQKVEVLKER